MHTRRIITTLILLPIFLMGIFAEYGHWLTAIVVAYFFFYAREELYELLDVPKPRYLMIWQNAIMIIFILISVFKSLPMDFRIAMWLTSSFFFFWGSCLFTIQGTVQGARYEISTHGLTLIYLLIPLGCLVYLRTLENGAIFLFFVLAISGFTDTGALYGGQLFGKHRLAPVISPKKTWEGAFFGSLFAVLIILIIAVIQSIYWDYTLWRETPHQYVEIILVTLIMSIIGQIGDLCESAMKRDKGIKDSGVSITGHGGFLDMMDSILWVSPAMLVYVKLIKS